MVREENRTLMHNPSYNSTTDFVIINVVLLHHVHGGMASDFKPKQALNQATDSGSETPDVTRGNECRATGHTKPLRVLHRHAEGMHTRSV